MIAAFAAAVGFAVAAPASAAPPVATDQSVTTSQGHVAQFSLSWTGSGSPAVTIVSPPSHGTLATQDTNSNCFFGYCSYTPTANYSGPDSFTWRVNDGNGTSGTATVSITVTPNQPPVTYDIDQGTVTAGLAISIYLNGSDPDDYFETLTRTIVTSPAHGSLSCDPDNWYLCTLTPTASYVGPDSFTYRATDSNGAASNTSTVSWQVAANQAPTLDDVSMEANANELTFVPFVAADPNNDPLVLTVVTPPSHGTFYSGGCSLGYCYYIGTPGYDGPDTFTARVSDGQVNSALATVSITVHGNAAPTVSDDFYYDRESRAIDLYRNASDPNQDTLTYTTLTSPAHGSLVCASQLDPTCRYTPTDGFTGEDSFTWKANDGKVDSPVATLTIQVTPNIPPVSYDVEQDVPSGQASTVSMSYSDGDFDPATYAIVTPPTHGTLTACTSYYCTYTPNTGFTGVDSFTYQVSDGLALSNISTVTLHVVPTNHAPVAVDQSGATTRESRALTLLPQVSDSDGDSLTVSIQTAPAHGILNGCAGPLAYCTYTPNAGYVGPDSFTWRASDGTLQSSTATFSLNVFANRTPTAVGSTAGPATAGEPLGFTLVGADADGDPLSSVILTTPAHGTVSCDAGSLFCEYTAQSGFIGFDTFSFAVRDDLGAQSPSATQRIQVGVNTPPTATSSSTTTRESRSVGLVLPATDPNVGQTLTYAVVLPPVHGSLTNCSTGTCTYTPTPGFVGTDSFGWKANDGLDDSAMATMTISVTADRAPTAFNVTLSGATAGVASPISLSGTDPDGDALTSSVVSGPLHGSLSCPLNTLSCTYTATVGYTGLDSFTYRVVDDLGLQSNLATGTISVRNLPPTANAGADVTVTEGGGSTLSGSGSDPDSPSLAYAWTYAATSGVDAGASCSFGNAAIPVTTFVCTDDGTYTVRLSVDDGVNPPVSDTAIVTVTNVAPSVSITSPASGSTVTVGDSLAVTASFADAGANDSHTCAIDWGDGNTTTGTISTGTCTGSHSYASAAQGNRTIAVRVTDDDGATGTDTRAVQVVPVPDPSPSAFAGPDVSGTEGSDVTLLGSGSDPLGQPVTYHWTYATGVGVDAGTTCSFGNASAATTSFRCDDDGTFTVTLAVDDGVNPPVTDSAVVTLANASPVVTVTAPASAAALTVGTSVSASATVSDAGTHDTRSCTIDWGDGVTTGGTLASGTCTGSHVYAATAVGARTIVVTVIDDDGGVGSDQVGVSVVPAPNAPPSADAGGNRTGTEGATLTLSGSGTDPEGAPLTYHWTYATGAGVDAGTTCSFGSPNAAVSSFQCDDDGTFTATLTVSDGVNSPVPATATVTLANANPTVTISAPVTGATVGINAPLSTTAAVGDQGAHDVLACAIAWGDGVTTTGSIAGGTCTGSHAYSSAGPKTVTVTVTDDDGGTSSDSVGVVVLAAPNEPPTASAGADVTGTEGSALTLTGSGSDPEQAPLTYHWSYAATAGVDAGTTCSFGSPNSAASSFSCDDDGTFTVTLSVSDGVNPPATDAATVTLANANPVVHLTTPAAGSEAAVGAPVSVSASVADLGAHDSLTCSIDWGDGVVGVGTLAAGTCTASHVYASTAAGARTISMTVIDDDSGSGADQVGVTVVPAQNDPPTADAGADRTGSEGTALTLTGSGSDPEHAPLGYHWTYASGAGVDSGTTCSFGSADAATTTFRCDDDGTFTVALAVDDGVNAPVTDTATVTLVNGDPTVHITDPASGTGYDLGDPVGVSASLADAGSHDALTCSILWGDGVTTDGTVAGSVCTGKHTYAADGTRTVTVTATDDDGGSGADATSVTIRPQAVNSPPTAEAGADQAGTEGTAVTLNGSGSDPEHAALTYHWTYAAAAGVDAGTTCSFGSANSASSTFRCDDDGTFTVSLAVDDGVNPPVSDTATVTLGNASPTVHVTTPSSGAAYAVGAAVTVNATLADAGSHDTQTCTIDWGDGTTGPGTIAATTCSGTHTYSAEATRTIAVGATDDDSGTGSDTTSVVIRTGTNAAPRANAGADRPGTEGSAVTLRGSGTDPEGAALTYHWSYTAGPDVDAGTSCSFGSAGAAVTTFRCDDDGTFTVTLSVNDGVNAPVSDSAIVTLANARPRVSITRPDSGDVEAGATVVAKATVKDAGAHDTQTCSIAWGDGTTTPGSVAAGVCTGSHVYLAPGNVSITVTATDDDGGKGSDDVCLQVRPAILAAATGSGAVRTDTGLATFAFSVKRTALGSSGWTTLDDGCNHFASTTTESLEVSGDRARWVGSGRWNGRSGYRYEVTAVAGHLGAKGKGGDTVEIIVRNSAGVVVATVSGVVRQGDVTVR